MQKLLSFFTSKNSLGVASIILVVTTALSRLMGIPRDYFLAQKIPSESLSVYNAAFLIPDFIVNIIIIGAISAAFIPVFVDYLNREKKEKAFELSNRLLNAGLLIILVYSILMFVFAPYVMKLIVPGFTADKIDQAVIVTRILIINPIFFAFSYVFGGILNSFKRFVAYSIAPILYNVGIITGTVLFADKFGILAPAFGAVLGAFLHMSIQMIASINLGYRYKFIIDFADKGLKEIGRLMLPRTIGLAASQISFVAMTAIASFYDPKGIALFNFANNIGAFIPSVFGITLAVAAFPTLSERVSRNQIGGFINTFKLMFGQIFFIAMPLTVLLVIFRAQVVRILLGSGYFAWENTITTASIIAAMFIFIFTQSLIPLLARSFYALKDTKTPVLISIISIAISIFTGYALAKGAILNWHFAKPLGVVGLGWALSVGSLIQLISLSIALNRRVVIFDSKKLFWSASKIIIASLILGFLAQGGKYLLGSLVDTHTRIGLIIQVVSVSILALIFYLFLSYIFKLPEFQKAKEIFYRRTKIAELPEGEEVNV